MPDLSTALKQAYARSDSRTRHMVALELLHAEFPGGAIRIVNYDDDVTVDGDLYTGMAMELKEPEIGSEPDNKVQVRVDGVSGEFQYWVGRALETNTVTGGVVVANIRPFAFNMVTESIIGVVGVFEYLITRVEYDMTTTIITAGFISPTNLKFPGVRYSPLTHPSLYLG